MADQLAPQWAAQPALTMSASSGLGAGGCVRSAALLGIVGAGGLGQEIEISMRMFQYSEVSTIILALVLIVVGIDRISAVVRRAS